MKITKTITDRGYSLNVEITEITKDSSRTILGSPTCKPNYYSQNGWFYYKVYTDNCAVMHMLSRFSNFQTVIGGIGFVASSFKVWQVGLASGALSYYYQLWKGTIENANYACGQTGILIEGNIWSAWYPIPKKKC